MMITLLAALSVFDTLEAPKLEIQTSFGMGWVDTADAGAQVGTGGSYLERMFLVDSPYILVKLHL